MTWRLEARCLGTDPAVFHPNEKDEQAELKAKQVCAPCPVKGPCLEYAITARELDGVWGGLTPLERRRLRRNGSRAV